MTVTEISEINRTINDVSDIVSTIATAVEEQSASTNEIASNVSQAALGINEEKEIFLHPVRNLVDYIF